MSPAARRIRVLLVDDHQLLTGSLSALRAREADIEVVGVAGTVAEARAIAKSRLDVVLMDYRLPDGTGAEATRAIKARWPAARVVMLTAVSDHETLLESIQAGADGYLTKDRAVGDIVSAVRAAYAGETLLPRAVPRHRPAHFGGSRSRRGAAPHRAPDASRAGDPGRPD